MRHLGAIGMGLEMNIKLHIYITDPESFLRGEYESCFTTSQVNTWTIKGWIYAGEVDLNIDHNETEVRGIALDGLDARIQEIRAAAEVGVTELEGRKQKLMALEHIVEGSND